MVNLTVVKSPFGTQIGVHAQIFILISRYCISWEAAVTTQTVGSIWETLADSLLLASMWPNPDCCGQLESEQANWNIFLFSASLPFQ